MPLKVHLRDRNPEVVKAWKAFFGRGAKVDIDEGNVLELPVSAIVSPLNSFGIMDTGLAQGINKATDGAFESRVRKLIVDKHAGELPVGLAEVLTSGIDSPRYVVVAPTLRVPARSTSANVNTYLATRAALRCVAAFMRKEREDKGEMTIESIAMVGMGTGSGACPPAVAAFQMYEAYCQIVLGQEPNFATIEAAMAHDQELRKNRYI